MTDHKLTFNRGEPDGEKKLTVNIDGTRLAMYLRRHGKRAAAILRVREPPPEPPPEPPEPPTEGKMLVGSNEPMWFGWRSCEPLIRPDNTLNPAYVHDMHPYRYGGNRYMEPMVTNNSNDVTVADMEIVNWQQWPSSGVPISYVADHAALLGQRPWVCVPHKANDQLIAHMAQQMIGLDPIVEYGNEPFNTGQSHSDWMEARGRELGYSGPHKREAIYLWTSHRTAEVAQIWEQIDSSAEFVFSIGMTDPPKDLSVIGSSLADMVSTAAYLGINSAWGAHQDHRDDTATQLLDRLQGEYMNDLLAWVASRKDDAGGLPLVIYEGGQHVKYEVVASSPEAQRHDRMYDVYYDLLQGLDNIGVERFMHYSSTVAMDASTGFKTFGAKEYTGQPDEQCPKWCAMRDFAA